eukprot:CAMPEP_0201248316 /NCGR_PEP_ID=MMETSP0852-20130820/56231_1 /ASSEMBLY_ACC=CAM_ASM_000632 /TAXON_ID=183588 /ORGANISM="Pseudo-nitzschia fraudulenta, Strain WWA7" /LENGTH=253 /DNA_ID=CAMNT_0047547037 /DNA_START=43 /DNA_END=801 /DNA_ORIENTATION=-
MPRGDHPFRVVGGVQTGDDPCAVQGQQTVFFFHVPQLDGMVPAAADQVARGAAAAGVVVAVAAAAIGLVVVAPGQAGNRLRVGVLEVDRGGDFLLPRFRRRYFFARRALLAFLVGARRRRMILDNVLHVPDRDFSAAVSARQDVARCAAAKVQAGIGRRRRRAQLVFGQDALPVGPQACAARVEGVEAQRMVQRCRGDVYLALEEGRGHGLHRATGSGRCKSDLGQAVGIGITLVGMDRSVVASRKNVTVVVV